MSDQPTTAIAVVSRDLPEPVQRRGIAEAQWLTLCNNLFPGANPKSVLMVWDYCAARGLDPMKKPCHIVPMEVKVGDEYQWRDVVMPGIYEYRITAHRTGEYLGHTKPTYGDEIEVFGVKAPESCEYTVYRWNPKAQQKVPFTVEIFFAEVVATRKDKQTRDLKANGRWTRAPKQMLTKCAEAAALREAFPEEIGGQPTAEEMEGRVISDQPVPTPLPTAWERISESLRDNLERAFTYLKLTEGQRLMKLNEYITPEGNADADAERLLEWCRDQLPSRKAKADNGKKVTQAPPPTPTVPVPVEPVAASSPLEASGGDTPATREPEAAPPPPATSREVPVHEIPWSRGELF